MVDFGENPPVNKTLRKTIFQVVENQIKDNNPPETRNTLERLMVTGYSRKEAKEKIASVLIDEIWHIMHNKEMFNERRFVGALNRLK